VLEELKAGGLYESTVLIVTGDHGSVMVNTAGKCCVHGAGHYEENLRVPFLLRLPGEQVPPPAGAT
jgi:arylsulfatase A-like enzyme